MFREIEGGHRMELKDINCENWLNFRGGETIFGGGGGELPAQPSLKKLIRVFLVTKHTCTVHSFLVILL